jgi:hypothetical protein
MSKNNCRDLSRRFSLRFAGPLALCLLLLAQSGCCKDRCQTPAVTDSGTTHASSGYGSSYQDGVAIGQYFATCQGMTRQLAPHEPLPNGLQVDRLGPEFVNGCRDGINLQVRANLTRQRTQTVAIDGTAATSPAASPETSRTITLPPAADARDEEGGLPNVIYSDVSDQSTIGETTDSQLTSPSAVAENCPSKTLQGSQPDKSAGHGFSHRRTAEPDRVLAVPALMAPEQAASAPPATAPSADLPEDELASAPGETSRTGDEVPGQWSDQRRELQIGEPRVEAAPLPSADPPAGTVTRLPGRSELASPAAEPEGAGQPVEIPPTAEPASPPTHIRPLPPVWPNVNDLRESATESAIRSAPLPGQLSNPVRDQTSASAGTATSKKTIILYAAPAPIAKANVTGEDTPAENRQTTAAGSVPVSDAASADSATLLNDLANPSATGQPMPLPGEGQQGQTGNAGPPTDPADSTKSDEPETETVPQTDTESHADSIGDDNSQADRIPMLRARTIPDPDDSLQKVPAVNVRYRFPGTASAAIHAANTGPALLPPAGARPATARELLPAQGPNLEDRLLAPPDTDPAADGPGQQPRKATEESGQQFR